MNKVMNKTVTKIKDVSALIFQDKEGYNAKLYTKDDKLVGQNNCPSIGKLLEWVDKRLAEIVIERRNESKKLKVK